MHDPEKSDSGIVATKPTNKAGRPVAEPAEPRPGTKGNADQQLLSRPMRARPVRLAPSWLSAINFCSEAGQGPPVLHWATTSISLAVLTSTRYHLSKSEPSVTGS